MGSAKMTSKLQSGQSPAPVRLSALARDNEKRGSRSHLANIGIHVQERRNSRHNVEKQLTDKTILIKDPEGNVVECEVLGTRMKESIFKKSVPILHPSLATLICFLNLIPGFGTFLVALSVFFGARTSFNNKAEGVGIGILTALLQLTTAFIIVGWFWSLMHGVYFIQKAKESKSQFPDELKSVDT